MLNVVHGFGPDGAGEALTTHPDVARVTFTGESRTGRAILAAVAPTLKPVSFELGGKSANIVFADADLDRAVPGSVEGVFHNTGQGLSRPAADPSSSAGSTMSSSTASSPRPRRS